MRRQQPSQPVPLLALTRAQVCEALQIGFETFDTWSHRHGFPVIRDGKTILVPIDSLQEWLRQQAASTNGEPETLADRVAGLRARSA
jgi:excisionase family DNA binding protein